MRLLAHFCKDLALLEAFHGALDEVEASSGPAALVTTGEGRFYSNGLDLEGLARGSRDGAGRVMREMHRLFARLLAFPVFTAAAVNGHAFAAGAMLALAHDFRVMRAGRGYLCLPEIDLATGQPLTKGMFALIRSRLGGPVFHEMLVTGRRYAAEDAAARGIVHEVRPEPEVVARAREVAGARARADRATTAALKRGLYEPALEALAEASA